MREWCRLQYARTYMLSAFVERLHMLPVRRVFRSGREAGTRRVHQPHPGLVAHAAWATQTIEGICAHGEMAGQGSSGPPRRAEAPRSGPSGERQGGSAGVSPAPE
ncbi:hypothetical protein B0H12DRAFT_1067163 [Mycena haematopus]|nr:hypothetical protein B0H12DRAFT_1067163 [Mycena haematopus]